MEPNNISVSPNTYEAPEMTSLGTVQDLTMQFKELGSADGITLVSNGVIIGAIGSVGGGGFGGGGGGIFPR